MEEVVVIGEGVLFVVYPCVLGEDQEDSVAVCGWQLGIIEHGVFLNS
jgi:hypothetical protein